jgi:Xaa-Pro aminopeptidase
MPFQSFDDPTAERPGRKRLDLLRAELQRLDLSGFLVPHSDEHQSEYLPPSAERLAWLTGFTGSAGMAIVLKEEAALFVDGRYTLQAQVQTDPDAWRTEHLIDSPPAKWLSTRLTPGDRLGYDPKLMTIAEVRRFGEVAKAAGAELVSIEENPVDRIWSDRPSPPLGEVTLHPIEFAGVDATAKVARLKTIVADRKADAAVLSAADSVAWAFNIRGRDIAHNPAPLAFAILPREGIPTLYLDGRKLSNAVRDALAGLADIREPGDFGKGLRALGKSGARVVVDPQATTAWIAQQIRAGGGTIVEGADPAALPKARKNAVELEGARRAHVRDGAAMVRFLAWLDRNAPPNGLDEIAAAQKLEELRIETARRDGADLADISFDTISGAGPNGAIVHYRVTRQTSRRLVAGMLYLVDSGGQYRDGTTDITRTVPIGTPTEEMRDRFTRVLKGHIAIAAARFPVGTTGAQIDALARSALWQAGLDYEHGTGHGVGSFLSVHEGPARISKLGHAPLEPGMILSNEPGYYKAGSFGIRIENLLAVELPKEIAGGDKPMLGFETITLAPIDRRLVLPDLLTSQETAWLNAYHARLLPALNRLLDAEDRAWLGGMTQPLSKA